MIEARAGSITTVFGGSEASWAKRECPQAFVR